MPASDFATTILRDLDTESSGGEPSPPPYRESLSSRFLRTWAQAKGAGRPMRQHLPGSGPLSRDSERAGAGTAPARPVLAGWRQSCAERSAHSPPRLYRVVAEGEGDDGEPEQTSPLEVILIASRRPHRGSALLGQRRRAPLRGEGGAGPRRALLPFTFSGGGRRFFRLQNPESETCWTVGWTSSCKRYPL